MKSMITIELEEQQKYVQTIANYRKETEILRTRCLELQREIEFLKDAGDNILVIVKDNNKPDRHEYKTTTKNLLVDLVSENQKVREKNDELSQNLQLVLLRLKDLENQYRINIDKMEKHIGKLENRSLFDRVLNKNVGIIEKEDKIFKQENILLLEE